MRKISIIIPIFNSEKYLEKCLNTIIKQTYRNIEIICINNNSTYNSLIILQEYKKKDDRIIILNEKNKGVSEARNLALENINSDYIMFVDSDDWIEPKTCEIALNTMEKYNADVVMWPYVKEYDGYSENKKIFVDNIIFEKKDVKEKLHRRCIGIINEELKHIENADALCTIWGKLYRSNIIQENNIRFKSLDEIGTYEDGLFNLKVLEKINRAVYINEYLYHYRKNNSDSITKKKNDDLIYKWKNLFQYMETYIEEKSLNDDYKMALQNRIALSIIGIGINVVKSDKTLRIKLKEIKLLLKSEQYKKAYRNIKIKYLDLKWKIFFMCCKYRLTIFVYILLKVICQKTRS